MKYMQTIIPLWKYMGGTRKNKISLNELNGNIILDYAKNGSVIVAVNKTDFICDKCGVYQDWNFPVAA